MLPLRSVQARGAMPDGPGSAGRRARSTRRDWSAEKVGATNRQKRLLPSGLPCLGHSRGHFSAVARATRTVRRTGVAVLRDPTADSLQAHVVETWVTGNAGLSVARRRSGTIASEPGGLRVGVCHG